MRPLLLLFFLSFSLLSLPLLFFLSFRQSSKAIFPQGYGVDKIRRKRQALWSLRVRPVCNCQSCSQPWLCNGAAFRCFLKLVEPMPPPIRAAHHSSHLKLYRMNQLDTSHTIALKPVISRSLVLALKRHCKSVATDTRLCSVPRARLSGSPRCGGHRGPCGYPPFCFCSLRAAFHVSRCKPY